MCIEASVAFKVSSGSLDYYVTRQIYDLSTISGLIQTLSVTNETSLIYVLRKKRLSDIEYANYIEGIIAKLKDKGYILKKVKHPDTNKFILDISWDLGGGLPSGV